MKFNYFTTKIPVLGLFSIVFFMTSCGSYEYVGSDSDGIYGQDERITVEYPPQQQAEVETRNDATYYKNYFSEKSKEYEYVFSDDEIFTDIDSYEGNYDEESDSLNYRKSYSGWGQTNSRVTINVVDNGWGAWGWYDPWLWDPWYYGGWGWNNWRWRNPWRWGPNYGWGWNNWGWNVGFGWGWNNWGWNNWGYGYPYYGYPYYNNYYGYYGGRGIAYNAGRRGSYLNRNYSSFDRRSTGTSRLNRSSSTVRSRSGNRVYDNRNRSTRPRSTARSNSGRNNSPRASTPRRSTPRVSTPRSNSGRSSGSINRSSSSSRSSGSRSSSSSRSGGSRSSSRR